MITQKYIKKLFNYKDGFLYWKVRLSKCIQIDDKAGYLQKDGYYVIRINNKLYKAHRLIFLYHHGYLPKFIDYIDRDPMNNYIKNLRKSTQSQNCMNRIKRKNCSSKYKGVYWHKQTKKWRSHITINNKKIYLGSFKSERAAAFIYNVYAHGAFGEFANLNNLEIIKIGD